MDAKLKYIVRVEPAPGCNPEFYPDRKMQEGIEGFGYIVIVFDEDGRPVVETLSGVSTFNLATYLAADKGGVSNILRQADKVADGLLAAQEIDRKHNREKMAKDLSRILGAGRVMDDE